MKSICLLVDYFGKWPCWFDMFLESVRYNDTVHWCIHTDCPIPDAAPPNVRFVSLDFHRYCEMVSEKLGVRFQPDNPYNICHLKPMYGDIHEDIIPGYDYFGWTDLDVMYGDIRSVYDDDILTYNVISANCSICAGHFTLIKNLPWLKGAYRDIRDWRGRLASRDSYEWPTGLDEAHLSALFSPDESVRLHLGELTGTHAPDPIYYSNNYFCQQWATPFTPEPWINGSRIHPQTWFWRNGALSNDRDGTRHFLYLHLMNFKAPTWVDEELYGQAPTWKDLAGCMSFTIDQLRQRPPADRRVIIDRTGIHLEP